MLLSEAILLGSVSNGQAFHQLKDKDGNTCAIGAAMEASGLTIKPQRRGGPVEKTWPYLQSRVRMPKGLISDYNFSTLWGSIVTLNNTYKWTRPQIAAWVAEQEVKLGIVNAEVKQEVSEADECKV